MSSPWPFDVWGINVSGPLHMSWGGAKYTVVPIDYFTKWVDVEPLATITVKKVVSFIVNNIITRFGIPHRIISDNGTQYESEELAQLC